MTVECTSAQTIRVGTLIGLIVSLVVVPGRGAAAKALPEFAEIEKAIQGHFAALPKYEPGDIITRAEVEPLLRQPALSSWLKADREAILARLPRENDFLVRELRTRKGRKFMSRISEYPGAYDRLDRMGGFGKGEKYARGIIHDRKGEQFIKLLTTTKHGLDVSKQLAKEKGGTDFDKPTGRIYTVEMLIAQLKKSHEKARKSLAGAK